MMEYVNPDDWRIAMAMNDLKSKKQRKMEARKKRKADRTHVFKKSFRKPPNPIVT